MKYQIEVFEFTSFLIIGAMITIYGIIRIIIKEYQDYWKRRNERRQEAFNDQNEFDRQKKQIEMKAQRIDFEDKEARKKGDKDYKRFNPDDPFSFPI